VINRAQRSAAQKQAQINGPKWISDPPDDLPLTEGGGGGGGSGMVFFLWRVPCYTWHRSIAPSPITICYLTDLRHHWTSPSTFPELVMSHNCCQSFPPIRSWQAPYYDFYLQSIASTSPIHIPQPPSPAISSSSDPLAIYYWITYPLSS
jgi:hypothetical protein